MISICSQNKAQFVGINYKNIQELTMKNTLNIVTLLALSISSNLLMVEAMAEENTTKRYPVSSAKISYEIKGAGEVMGMIKTETLGKKRVIFNAFGMNELTEENKVEKRTHNGETTIDKQHTIKYMKRSTLYSVDFNKKQIMRSENQGLAMAQALMGSNKDMATAGKEMMLKMGAKNTGTDKVAGYSCEVWEMLGSTQCLYKGIPLRVVSDVMGIKSTEVATKVEFDIELSKDDFKLPDFPVFQIDMDRMMAGMKPLELDKTKLDAMDKKADLEASKNVSGAQEAFKSMAEAAKQAGIKKGDTPTAEQAENMMANMKNKMFPMIKQKVLKEEAMVRFGAECFKDAETLKDANKCNDIADEKFPDQESSEKFDAWTPEIKAETLNGINQFLGSIDCIKASTNMGELEKCMPRN